MPKKNLWCKREEEPISNNSVCGLATLNGELLCPGHKAEGPIWPVNPDGSLFDYGGVSDAV